MLLAVKANRSTLISSASSGNCVSINLHCCKSVRATTKSVDFIFSIPAVWLPRSLRLTMNLLQQLFCLKQRSALPRPSSHKQSRRDWLTVDMSANTSLQQSHEQWPRRQAKECKE